RRRDAGPASAPGRADAAIRPAARFGLAGSGAVPGAGLVPVGDATARLADALDAGDADRELIASGLRRVMEQGTGAERQRGAAGEGGWAMLRGYLAEVLAAG